METGVPKNKSRSGVAELSPWAERLTRPLSTEYEDVREELSRLMLGRIAAVAFGAVCLTLVSLSYIFLVDPGLGGGLLALSAAAIAVRIVALTRFPVSAPLNGEHLEFVLKSGLLYAGAIGVVGYVCGVSGQAALVTLAGMVITGLAFGVAFINAGAPLFAKCQVALMGLPILSSTLLAEDPQLAVVALQAPIWIFGVFRIVNSSHRQSAQLLVAQKRNRYLAFNDELTGLANRAHVLETIDVARRSPLTTCYLLYLDLDGFKPINDRFGHSAGDALLRGLAGRFRTVLRSQDIIGRIGGDEFIVILRDMAFADIEQVAARLLEVARQPFAIGAASVSVGVSVGGAPLVFQGDPDRAVAAADEMLYAAKRAGKGQVRLAAA